MSGGGISEGIVEQAALDWFRALGCATLAGAALAPGGTAPERTSYDQVVLTGRLRDAALRINPGLPSSVVEQAVTRLLRAESQNALAENERVHQLLTGGVPVEHHIAVGEIRTALVWLVDWDEPAVNDWLVVHQFTVVDGGKNRRADVVVFLNGLPVGVLGLKNPGDAHATLRGAWNQVQTYRRDVPVLFTSNALVVISDGTSAAMGSFTAGWEHYAPWKTIDGRGGRDQPAGAPSSPVRRVRAAPVPGSAALLRRLLRRADLAGQAGREVPPVLGGQRRGRVHHRAHGPDGDRRGGVVWHTQGSGKSIEMLLYAAKIMRSTGMGNPTLVFVTDRNDLDDQLFGEVFAPARVLPEQPRKAESRADVRQMLSRASGGIGCATVQKFAPEANGDLHPVLTDRRKVVVIADEAHRSNELCRDRAGRARSHARRGLRGVAAVPHLGLRAPADAA